ncbi:hypothetical protein CO172_01845 [Candidatus Uhrbacteria bacterium CG_4_9_14_3_um_filter_36_7]|uniref:Uncharacterized protein n=1 Tax=Candidatus Uhrbacteria bacterium CG_4_9_14_3_um_filter_36_7 TaxID=1975033 RepID=A0A2M7XHN4_9BACT|nr:MAG: hypothetical protein CO172_01845 [Candidatus Uhrbacteria bacterium CG_4_9_14_3_um_filter_36_7]
MNEQWKQLLQFVRKTQDRMVVMDPEGDELVVILPFKEYEQMVIKEDRKKNVSIEKEISEKEKNNVTVWDTMVCANDSSAQTWQAEDVVPTNLSENKEIKQIKKEDNQVIRKSHEENPVISSTYRDPDEDQFFLEPLE